MDQVTFPAQTRDKSVTAKNLRKINLIPAEYYGRGIENLSLQLDYQSFRKLFRKAGSNTVIDLDVEGKGVKKVLIQHVVKHPVTDLYSHVDFINVRMDEKVTTTVPIRLEGQAPAVKDLAGILIQNLHEIEVTCLPGDLIHEVILDLSSLVDFNTSLHVSDIKVPSTITILTDLETSVAQVVEPQEEEVAPAEPVDVASVEVTTEKKEGEEGAAGGTPAVEEAKKEE